MIHKRNCDYPLELIDVEAIVFAQRPVAGDCSRVPPFGLELYLAVLKYLAVAPLGMQRRTMRDTSFGDMSRPLPLILMKFSFNFRPGTIELLFIAFRLLVMWNANAGSTARPDNMRVTFLLARRSVVYTERAGCRPWGRMKHSNTFICYSLIRIPCH